MDTKKEKRMEEILNTLDTKKDEWAALSYREKAKLLGEMLEIFRGLDHEAWARESVHTQGYEKVVPDVYVAIEMVMNTSYVVGDLETLCDVQRLLILQVHLDMGLLSIWQKHNF